MNRTLIAGLLLATAAFAQEGRVRMIGPDGLPLQPPAGGQDVVYTERHTTNAADPKVASMLSDVVMTRFVFDGKPVKGAPYSGEASTESTQVLADGNRITRKNTAVIYRDGQGRTRREETMNGMGLLASAESFQTISINDPVAQVSYILDAKTKTARKLPNITTVGVGDKIGMVIAGKGAPGMEQHISTRVLAPGKENANTEQLGKQTIDGLVCDGTRTTITIPAGQMGNERPIEIVSERWYSPDLQLTVMSRHNDPRMGETVYKLNRINRAEPLPSLFQVPADYTINTDGPMIRTFRKDSER